MALSLDFKAAHRFVRDQRKMGSDVRWDGWDMVFWKPTRHGFATGRKTNGSVSTVGAFKNGRWGVEARITVSDDGMWKVPARNVKKSA